MKVDPITDRSRRRSVCKFGGLVVLPTSWLAALCSPVPAVAALPRLPARIIRVGPGGDTGSLSKAARMASDGDIVEVEPGDYRRDTAVWAQRDLVIRGIGERPRLIADGADAEGKGIFVVRGDRIRIENLAFLGARVRDHNGAGIRLERGHLELSNCHFEDNENGVLSGNDARSELAIDRCSFVENGAGDGRSHNLYVGAIASLTVSASYFSRARVGHLLKSRARENQILYCRLSGEGGTSSYELEFPNGGLAMVLGCLIEQGPRSENATIISYGTEGYRWPRNELQLTFNTIVNDRPQGGLFVRVSPGHAYAELLDNLLVGPGDLDVKIDSAVIRNTVARRGEFADPTRMNYHLRKSSPHVGAAGAVGQLAPGRRYPEQEYLHPASSRALPAFVPLTPLSPGAFQMLAD